MTENASTFTAENEAFNSKKTELLKICPGKFAVFKGAEFLGVYDTAVTAYEAGIAKFGNVPFLVKRVAEHESELRLPAFCLGFYALMPTHNFPTGITIAGHPNACDLLAEKGLLLQIEIGLPEALAATLVQASKPVPAPSTGLALIDTGAGPTALEDSVLVGLGLQPIRQVSICGQSGTKLQNVYVAELSFPGSPIPKLALEVVGVQIADQGLAGLIGRDILRYCVLIYNGQMGSWSVSF